MAPSLVQPRSQPHERVRLVGARTLGALGSAFTRIQNGNARRRRLSPPQLGAPRARPRAPQREARACQRGSRSHPSGSEIG